MTPNQNLLFKKACEVQKKAHAPYSGALIGAAILMANGDVFTGCNVENASYGGTVCAERVAIFKAISEGTSKEVLEVLVVSDAKDPWPPCGFCRQVIAEFAKPTSLIHTFNLQGVGKTFSFQDIFPEAFTPSHLKT